MKMLFLLATLGMSSLMFGVDPKYYADAMEIQSGFDLSPMEEAIVCNFLRKEQSGYIDSSLLPQEEKYFSKVNRVIASIKQKHDIKDPAWVQVCLNSFQGPSLHDIYEIDTEKDELRLHVKNLNPQESQDAKVTLEYLINPKHDGACFYEMFKDVSCSKRSQQIRKKLEDYKNDQPFLSILQKSIEQRLKPYKRDDIQITEPKAEKKDNSENDESLAQQGAKEIDYASIYRNRKRKFDQTDLAHLALYNNLKKHR